MNEFIKFTGTERLSQAQLENIWVVANDLGLTVKRLAESLPPGRLREDDDEVVSGNAKLTINQSRACLCLEDFTRGAKLTVNIVPILGHVGIRVNAGIEPFGDGLIKQGTQRFEDPSGTVFLAMLRELQVALGDLLTIYR